MKVMQVCHSSSRTLRVLSLVLTLLCLVGCVGMAPVTTETRTSRMCPVFDQVGELRECIQGEPQSVTVERVLTIWGQPASRGAAAQGQEHLVYDRSVAWRGSIIFVVIPIPLLAPVGHNRTTLFFEQGVLVNTAYEYGQDHFVGCGVIGCYSGKAQHTGPL